MLGKMDCFGITDIGRRRSTNEDQFLIADLNKSMRVYQTSLGLNHQARLFGNSQGKLLAVADGLGGHEAGERASQLVVDSVVTYVLNTLHWFFRLDAENDENFRDELKAALQHCQLMLQQDVEATPQRRGMGTTLTMAYVIWPKMFVVHVGDSRCYLLRDGKLKQITRDHTLAQLYKETHGDPPEGDIEADEVTQGSNTLWNVISSTGDVVDPEVYLANLQLGDTVLLCTDGLTKHVDRSRLIDLLESKHTAEAICQGLVDAANSEGGSDNITVIVSRFCEGTGAAGADVALAEVPADESQDTRLRDTGEYVASDTQVAAK
ncbi:MAG: protein phosphatase 2C domain-containing protein [Planctomycetota bacterium]